MSFLTQAYLLETYGPRIKIADCATVLGMAEKTLRNKISARQIDLPMYVDCGVKCADYRDLAQYLDDCRARAKTPGADLYNALSVPI